MDIVKLVVLIIGACLIMIVGIFYKNKYKKKSVIINQIFELVNSIEIEMQFSYKDIRELIQEKSKLLEDELSQNLDIFLENKKLNIDLYDENENIEINNFFNSLGECSLDIELNKINHIKRILTEMKSKYERLLFSNGQLYFKLAVCASLVFIVVFA